MRQNAHQHARLIAGSFKLAERYTNLINYLLVFDPIKKILPGVLVSSLVGVAMDVYLVSFNSPKPPDVAREIAHMIGQPGGIEVRTSIEIHSRDRRTPDDYDTMVAFSFSAPNTFRLHDLPVYVDDRHTSVYYAKNNLYAIFKSNLADNAWNIVRHLLPAPDRVLNWKSGGYSRENGIEGVTFVDTTAKPSVFDERDVWARHDQRVLAA